MEYPINESVTHVRIAHRLGLPWLHASCQAGAGPILIGRIQDMGISRGTLRPLIRLPTITALTTLHSETVQKKEDHVFAFL